MSNSSEPLTVITTHDGERRALGSEVWFLFGGYVPGNTRSRTTSGIITNIRCRRNGVLMVKVQRESGRYSERCENELFADRRNLWKWMDLA